MNTTPRLRVKTFNIALGCALCFVAFLMQLVMHTDVDRRAYLQLFSTPFWNGRIEPGFQYYMNLLKIADIPPSAGIVITSVLIYALLARVWFAYIKGNWLESILLFNFFTFSLFNYYLGTSLRMGLATAVALYASMHIMRGNKIFLIALWLSPLLQYGTAPFALITTWVLITKKLTWRVHQLFIVLATALMPLAVSLLLQVIGLNKYYMQYFNSTMGQTGRIFPFVFVFFVFALVLSFLKGADTSARRIIFYGLPFFFFGAITGVPIFAKMLIPNIFLSAIVVTKDYRSNYIKNIDPNARFLIAVVLNSMALAYALKQYGFI